MKNMLSSFIKIRQLPELPHNDAYVKLSNTIKGYYEFCKANPQKRLYEVMQGVDEDYPIKMDEKEWEEFLGFEQLTGNTWWKVDPVQNQDHYWYYIKAKKRAENYKIGPLYIKVTLSVKDYYGIEVFLSIVRELLNHAENEFQGKFTKYSRLETMVFWVNRNEFDLIERFVKRYDDVLITPLAFAGYRGKLGVSRDLYSWGSHNSRQVELIQDYFKFIDDRESISLEGMYQFLIDSWNDVLPDSKKWNTYDGRNPYAECDAQLLIILLESLFVILGEREITDDHIFLQQDVEIWEPLGRSCTWESYEKALDKSYDLLY
jgi:hypothetical protein